MANGPVLVVDFGAQYAQLIARRVRTFNVLKVKNIVRQAQRNCRSQIR